MITDEERREVARRLRKLAGGYVRVGDFEKALGIDMTSPTVDLERDARNINRLADLIEPSGHECVPGECPINVRHDNDRIDRDALLELADEMYEFGSLPVKHQGVRVLHSEDFSREFGYARRIRKALGVRDA